MSECYPIDNWDRPRDGLFHIITHSWWVVDDSGRPVVSKYNTPQCSDNRDIALRIANRRPLVFFPVVYLSIAASDFA